MPFVGPLLAHIDHTQNSRMRWLAGCECFLSTRVISRKEGRKERGSCPCVHVFLRAYKMTWDFPPFFTRTNKRYLSEWITSIIRTSCRGQKQTLPISILEISGNSFSWVNTDLWKCIILTFMGLRQGPRGTFHWVVPTPWISALQFSPGILEIGWLSVCKWSLFFGGAKHASKSFAFP